MPGKWLNYACLALVLQFSRSAALGIDDLFHAVNDPSVSPLIHETGIAVEPFVQTTAKDWKYRVPRDSVKNAAYRILAKIEEIRDTANGSKRLLLKGLLWYYLYRLEVDSALDKADSVFVTARRTIPCNQGVAWFGALLSVEGMRTFEGFRILDSLRNNGMSANRNFMLDYARLCAESFLPNGQSYAENIRIQSSPHLDIRDLLTDQELVPFRKSWGVTIQSHEQGIEYTFTTGFMLQELMALQFPSLNGYVTPKPLLRLDSTFNVRFDPPVLELFNGMFTMELRIVVDINNFTIPLKEYMYSLVNNRFDMVERHDDLAGLHAVSVRCYKKNIFRNVSGDYYAYIVFDCNRCSMRNRSTSKLKPGRHKEIVPLRYLIVMKTSQPVAAKSEAILKNFLSQFEANVN